MAKRKQQQFKVTVLERVTQYRSKVFTARNAEEARQLAEADDSWTPSDGWEDGYSDADVSIEEVEAQ